MVLGPPSDAGIRWYGLEFPYFYGCRRFLIAILILSLAVPIQSTYEHCLSHKVKLKLFLCLTKHHATKAYWGSEGIAARILWPRHWMEVSCQLHDPAALSPGKEPLVPIG
jgi:hypothetical protein